MLDTVVQAAALSAFSNVLAQLLEAYQKETAYTNIDFVPVIQFVVYSILNTPINIIWQVWLEATFPSNTPQVPPTSGKSKVSKQETKMNVGNTLKKFALDQTIGAAFNTPLFIGIMGMLKGQNLAQILGAIERDSWTLYTSGLKLWPAVSLFNFAIVPPQQRIIVGSIAGIIWTIYLSLMAK